MDDEQRLLLDEVLSDPDADDARLIYADWLEERDDPRGEFIRVQCELARADPLSERYCDLSERNAALLAEHRDGWIDELQQDVSKAKFHRGFIDTITVRARQFVKVADDLFRNTPVHWLRLTYMSGAGEQLAELPALQQIRSLDLSSLSIKYEDLLAFLSSPHLSQLRDLNLLYHELFHADLGRVISSPRIAESLRSLNVIEQNDSRGFMSALCGGDGFPEMTDLAFGSDNSSAFQNIQSLSVPRLNSLKIRGTMTVSDAENVARLPVSQLKQLDLGGSRVPARGIQALAGAGALDEVEELNLGGADIPGSGLRSLFQGERLSRCEQFAFTGSHPLAESGSMRQLTEALAGHAPLSSLRQLQLGWLRNSELAILAGSEPLQQLQSLSCNDVRLTEFDAQAIVDSGLPQTLRRLSFTSASFTPNALRMLCSTEFPNLLWLDFATFWDPERPTEEEVIHLIESAAFPALRSLELTNLPLTADTLYALATRSHFPKLNTLRFQGNRADNDSVRAVLTSDRLPRLSFLSIKETTGLRNRPKFVKEFSVTVEF